MSLLVDRAIDAAGLAAVARARRSLDFERLHALAPIVRSADLLAVGALADRIRSEEVGEAVILFAGTEPDVDPDVITIGADEERAGRGKSSVLLRVAEGRILGPRAARVRVDWATSGIELAQIALGFGANELLGPVLNRRGLPVVADSTKKVKGAGLVSSQLLKKKELATLVRMAGRIPVFAGDEPKARRTAEGGLVDHA